MANEVEKIIYTMYKVAKTYNNKPVIKDISLSYFYGAKIGILGLNGSGKSTLLRIMAGVEDLFDGELLDCKKLVLTREDIVEFARKFDPQPFVPYYLIFFLTL